MRRQDIKQGIRDAEPVHRCWAPAGRRQCSNECIKSHTVQKSLLDRMARNHKVYSTRWTNMIGKNGEVIDRDSKRPELVPMADMEGTLEAARVRERVPAAGMAR